MKNTLKRLAIALTLMLCATTTVVGSGAFLFYNAVGSDAPYILRDLVFMFIAEAHEDDPVSFEADISYVFVEINRTSTNSQWLYEMVEEIMPYLQYEGATTRPLYPKKMGIEPYSYGSRSLHIAGWAVPSKRYMYINEWYVEERGLEEILGTIVHELIHCQGGIFAEGTTKELEAHTVAATTEVVAAMCLRGDEVACQAFWVEISDLATRSFRFRMEEHNLKWLSELIMDVFFRDAEERARADKTNRYFSRYQWTRREILNNYGRYPWEEYVIPGVKGQDMQVMEEPPYCEYYYAWGYCGMDNTHMEFDDTREMLGAWVFLLGGNDGGQD